MKVAAHGLIENKWFMRDFPQRAQQGIWLLFPAKSDCLYVHRNDRRWLTFEERQSVHDPKVVS
jgi:hypothetical protein